VEISVKKYPPISVKEFYENTARLGTSKIEVYDYQNELFNCQDKFRLVNKARQIGISTAIAMEALYNCIWFPNQTNLFISTGERTSRELMDKVKSLLNTIEPFSMVIKDGLAEFQASTKIKIDTKTAITFENGSRILSLPNNPDNIRGFTATHVYIDEYAHFENPDEIWEAVLPSITRGGKVTVVSTPKGKQGKFYMIYDEVKRGESDFKMFEFHYTRVKDPIIIQNIEKNKPVMSDIQFRQEYECEFIDEAISYFPYELLNPAVNEDIESIYTITTGNPVYVGIDFGALRSSTVITIAEKIDKTWVIRPPIKEFIGKKRIEGEKAETDFSNQLDYIRMMIQRVRPTRVFLDSTGYGLPLLEELRRQFGGLVQGVNFNNALKENLITALRILFENKQIKIPRVSGLIDQLHSLEKTTTIGGYARFRHTAGKFDDYVWSLCLAVSTETQKPGVFKIVGIKR
jgi:phage FluMu gp28-like protein